MRTWALCLALLGAVSLHAAETKATKQYVSLDKTRLLSKPTAFAKANAILKQGTIVWVEPAKKGYAKVKVDATGATGYLSVRALQEKKPKTLANAKRSGDASAQEVAAATKGFNKQVEADLRGEGKSTSGYEKLDTLVERTKVDDPAGSTEKFREDGKLGEFQKGAE